MAKPAKSAKNETKITRISASDDTKEVAKTKPVKVEKQSTKKTTTPESTKAAKKVSVRGIGRGIRRPFVASWRYIKGAWQELRQVRWPDRRSTWGMTGALLLFTLFFVVVILLLDYGFSQLFNLLISN